MRARVCVCVRVRINDESIGFLMTVFAVYFNFTRLDIFPLVQFFVVHTINILSHTLSRNIRFIRLVIFLSIFALA